MDSRAGEWRRSGCSTCLCRDGGWLLLYLQKDFALEGRSTAGCWMDSLFQKVVRPNASYLHTYLGTCFPRPFVVGKELGAT